MNRQAYIQEQYKIAYEKYFYTCFCGRQANQIAHIIPNRKQLLNEYGYRIINHNNNLRPVCCLACNAESQINTNTCELKYKVAEIMRIISDDIIGGI